jgi:hypothetical protein
MTTHVTSAEMNVYARELRHLQRSQSEVDHPAETRLRAGMNDGPVLVRGVTPFTNGTVVATVPTVATGSTASIPMAQVATAPIDASGKFVLRANLTSGPLAQSIADGWLVVNIEARQGGASRKAVSSDFDEEYVNASGNAFSLAKLRAAPGSGHWLSMRCVRGPGLDKARYRVYTPDGDPDSCGLFSARINLRHELQYDR